MKFKTEKGDIEWTLRRSERDSLPCWVYENMLEFITSFGNPRGFYARMLGAIIGALTTSPGKLEHHNSALISLDVHMLIHQKYTMFGESVIQNLPSNFSSFYTATLDHKVNAAEENNAVDFRYCNDIGATLETVRRLGDKHKEHVYRFARAFDYVFQSTKKYPTAVKFLCLKANDRMSIFKRELER